MKKLNSAIFLIFVLVFLFLFSPLLAHVQAAQNFQVSFDVTYSVSENGLTHAIFNGVLQNTSDSFYASSYTLQTGFGDLQNAKAYDQNGTINPDIKKSDRGSSIFLKFNAKAIGNNAKLPFSFSFDTINVAKKVGNIWEINIPGVANPTDFNSFNIHLKVPKSFGSPAYVKPLSAGNGLDFPKEILGSSGISLAFGKFQTFNFNLKYHLKNLELFPKTMEIAIPPSTNYQSVSITSISPKPKDVVIDADGNWLAKYDLLPSQSIEVIVSGTSTLQLFPSQQSITDDERKQYLKPDKNWGQNKEIKNLAKELQTAKNIYDYVVSHLHYDFSRVIGTQERLGAEKVLESPQSAVCLEFTDLFIALSRAAGIPAREVNGYAYTQNIKERPLSLIKDVLHAWPEYYDDATKTWIMVDPTWANTTGGVDYFDTLDFDHFAFVIKGEDSEQPIPAGGYKLSGTEKDVFVSFGQDFLAPTPIISLDYLISPFSFAGTAVSGNLLIKNEGNVLVPAQYISITSNHLLPQKQVLLSAPIAPYGNVMLPVTFKKTSFLTFFSENITINVGDRTVTKKITVYPFFLQVQFIIGGLIFVLLCIIILIIAAKIRRLQISKRKTSGDLRGQSQAIKK